MTHVVDHLLVLDYLVCDSIHMPSERPEKSPEKSPEKYSGQWRMFAQV